MSEARCCSSPQLVREGGPALRHAARANTGVTNASMYSSCKWRLPGLGGLLWACSDGGGVRANAR